MGRKIKSDSKLLTLLFVDIADYTKTTNNLSREAFDKLHDTFDSMTLKATKVFGGRIIKKIGDAFLITFQTATDAVLCGIELQNHCAHLNETGRFEKPIYLRVALHTGEVMVRDGDVYGDPVNMASRLEGLAKPGDVVFSETVYFAMNRSEIEYQHIGQRKVKGSNAPIRVFRVKNESDILREKRLRRKKRYYAKKKKQQKKLIVGAFLAFGIFMLLLLIGTLLVNLM